MKAVTFGKAYIFLSLLFLQIDCKDPRSTAELEPTPTISELAGHSYIWPNEACSSFFVNSICRFRLLQLNYAAQIKDIVNAQSIAEKGTLWLEHNIVIPM